MPQQQKAGQITHKNFKKKQTRTPNNAPKENPEKKNR
jgi:hypothetical protein